jgi:hypothetical protein
MFILFSGRLVRNGSEGAGWQATDGLIVRLSIPLIAGFPKAFEL